MTKRPHFRLMLPLAAGAIALLSACGSSSGGGDAQVASIATAGSSGATATKASSGDTEKELNDYTECLRKQGVKNVPDISVDADGNPSFGSAAGGAGAGQIDQDALTAAQKVCGDLPSSFTSSMSKTLNSTEFQDSALKFAQCMRKEGIDMKDPDFSQATGAGAAGGNPFGDLDRDDPKTSAALEICQKEFAGVTGGGN